MQVTEQYVEHIINDLKTWIVTDPVWDYQDGRFKIELPVQNEENLELRFVASKADTQIATPKFSYLFNNQRIRGLDYHVTKFIDGNGQVQTGWHEHIWSNHKKDNNRFTNEDFEYIPENKQIDYVLKRWKIIYREQLKLEL